MALGCTMFMSLSFIREHGASRMAFVCSSRVPFLLVCQIIISNKIHCYPSEKCMLIIGLFVLLASPPRSAVQAVFTHHSCHSGQVIQQNDSTLIHSEKLCNF